MRFQYSARSSHGEAEVPADAHGDHVALDPLASAMPASKRSATMLVSAGVTDTSTRISGNCFQEPAERRRENQIGRWRRHRQADETAQVVTTFIHVFNGGVIIRKNPASA